EEALVLEHAIEVEPHRNEREHRIRPRALEPDDVVEEARLRRTQTAVARELSLDEEARHAPLAHEDLHVALEYLVVERILLAASDEVAPEGAEEHVERPDERPLADRAAERDMAQEPVRPHD